MPTNFPTSLDNLTNPTASDSLNTPAVEHDDQHANANDAIEALEAKVGVNGSTVPTSLDHQVARAVNINELPRSPLQATYGGAFTAANILAAASGGAPVHLPAGTCPSVAITLPAGTFLKGIPGKTILQAAAGASSDILTSGGAGIILEDVILDGNKAAITTGATGYGFLIGHDDCTVRRCIIKNSRLSGIRTFDADGILIELNRLENCGDATLNAGFLTNGVTVQGHNNRILNNYFTGTGGQGVGQSAAAANLTSGMIVHGNIILGSGTFGIALGNRVTNFKVTDNYIDGATAGNCIDTGSALFGTIANNTCLNAGFDGIDIDLTGIVLPEDEVGLLITGNRSITSGRYGIVVFLPSSATGVTISDNQVDTCGTTGISTSNLWNAIITSNSIRNQGVNAPGHVGLQLSGNSQHNLISDNTIFEDRVTPQSYGFSEFSGGTYGYNTLVGNDFSRCSAPYAQGTPTSGPNTGDLRGLNR